MIMIMMMVMIMMVIVMMMAAMIMSCQYSAAKTIRNTAVVD